MRRNRSIHTLRGKGEYDEIRLWLLPVWTYARRRVQTWSMYMDEIEIEQGFRIGWWRFGATRSFLVSTHYQTGERTTRHGKYGL